MMVAWVVYVSVSSALSCQKQGVWVSGIVRISLLCVFKHRFCVLECEQEPRSWIGLRPHMDRLRSLSTWRALLQAKSTLTSFRRVGELQASSCTIKQSINFFHQPLTGGHLYSIAYTQLYIILRDYTSPGDWAN